MGLDTGSQSEWGMSLWSSCRQGHEKRLGCGADPGVRPNTVLGEQYLWGTASTQLTDTGRVTFQH